MIKYFQKIKWDVLARLRPHYYIFSDIKEKDEKLYQESGIKDVQRLIMEDNQLSSLINFKEADFLEIGCGNGRMTEYIANQFQNVYAVDISKTMVNLGQRRLSSKNNIHWLVNDGKSLPIESKKIDLVFSYMVFHHFPNIKMVEANLKEVGRVLKEGGIAKIQLRGRPAYGGPFRIFRWYYGVYLDVAKITDIANRVGLNILRINGEKTKELWVILQKEEESSQVNLNQVEEDFIEFISKKRNRSLEETRDTFLKTKARFDFASPNFKKLCGENYELFRIFHDDTEEKETLDSYRFHAPIHLFRFISYSYDKKRPRLYVKGLKAIFGGDFRKISRFIKKKFSKAENKTTVVGYHNIAKFLVGNIEKPVVVDYGCGLGYIPFEIARIKPDSKIYLVDIESLVSEFTLYRFKKHGISAEFIPISEDNLYPELPPHNICIAAEVVEHLFEPLKFYENMNKSLERGGILCGDFGNHEDYMFHVSPQLDSFKKSVLGNFDEISEGVYRKIL